MSEEQASFELEVTRGRCGMCRARDVMVVRGVRGPARQMTAEDLCVACLDRMLVCLDAATGGVSPSLGESRAAVQHWQRVAQDRQEQIERLVREEVEG